MSTSHADFRAYPMILFLCNTVKQSVSYITRTPHPLLLYLNRLEVLAKLSVTKDVRYSCRRILAINQERASFERRGHTLDLRAAAGLNDLRDLKNKNKNLI